MLASVAFQKRYKNPVSPQALLYCTIKQDTTVSDAKQMWVPCSGLLCLQDHGVRESLFFVNFLICGIWLLQ